jgi:hypothetical protein
LKAVPVRACGTSTTQRASAGSRSALFSCCMLILKHSQIQKQTTKRPKKKKKKKKKKKTKHKLWREAHTCIHTQIPSTFLANGADARQSAESAQVRPDDAIAEHESPPANKEETFFF